MNQKEILNKCKEHGLEVSIPLIYRIGKKEGFIVKNDNYKGREKYDIDEQKFNDWLSKKNISDEYIAIRDAMKLYNIPYAGLKYQLEKNGCEIVKLGIANGGRYHAKRADVERIIAQYTKRS